MLPNNVLAIGLHSGNLAVWNIADGSFNEIPCTNQVPISTMITHQQHLIIGDNFGVIRVLDSSSGQMILQSPPHTLGLPNPRFSGIV